MSSCPVQSKSTTPPPVPRPVPGSSGRSGEQGVVETVFSDFYNSFSPIVSGIEYITEIHSISQTISLLPPQETAESLGWHWAEGATNAPCCRPQATLDLTKQLQPQVYIFNFRVSHFQHGTNTRRNICLDMFGLFEYLPIPSGMFQSGTLTPDETSWLSWAFGLISQHVSRI